MKERLLPTLSRNKSILNFYIAEIEDFEYEFSLLLPCLSSFYILELIDKDIFTCIRIREEVKPTGLAFVLSH